MTPAKAPRTKKRTTPPEMVPVVLRLKRRTATWEAKRASLQSGPHKEILDKDGKPRPLPLSARKVEFVDGWATSWDYRAKRQEFLQAQKPDELRKFLNSVGVWVEGRRRVTFRELQGEQKAHWNTIAVAIERKARGLILSAPIQYESRFEIGENGAHSLVMTFAGARDALRMGTWLDITKMSNFGYCENCGVPFVVDDKRRRHCQDSCKDHHKYLERKKRRQS